MQRDIEKAFIFSEPFEDLTGGESSYPIRNTGGIDYWIRTGSGYVFTATTTVTKLDWATICRNVFQYKSAAAEQTGMKVALLAPLLIDMLSSWKDDGLRFTPRDDVYGLRVHEWETGHGTLLIARDQILENSPFGDGTGYGNMGFVVDPGNLEYRYLKGRDLRLNMNVVKDGTDGTKDELLAEVGVGIKNPETMGKIAAVSTWE